MTTSKQNFTETFPLLLLNKKDNGFPKRIPLK